METSNSGSNHPVLHVQNDRWGLGPLRLVILVQKSLFCMHKTNGEGWNPYGPDTLVLSTLLYVLKTTDVV